MALFQTTLRSHALGMSTGVNILVPTDVSAIPEGGYPVLYLLHGLSDDHTTWLRNTRIESYAERYGLAVVMPEGHKSFYTDMVSGMDFGRYISEELPAFCRKTFPISKIRDHTYIAGLSMGGYGALKMGLCHPQNYAACAGLSPATAPVEFEVMPRPEDDPIVRIWHSIDGFDLENSQRRHDLPCLAEGFVALPLKDRTRIYFACGTDDFLYDQNQVLRKKFDQLNVQYTYEEGPGTHNWDFWDAYIQKALAFFLEG